MSIFYPTSHSAVERDGVNVLSLFNPAIDKAKEVFLDMGIDETALESPFMSLKDNLVPELNDPYPVVIFSPGFGIDRDLYIDTITSVVQSGYVVVSVGTPYDSFLTVYPNGKVVSRGPAS